MTYPFRDGEGALKYAQTYAGDGSQANPYVLSEPQTQPQSTTITSYNHSKPSITDTGATVLVANTNRKAAVIVNRSTTDTVELTFASTALAYGLGFPLQPGQSYQINSTNLYAGAIAARTATGITVDLAVLEGV